MGKGGSTSTTHHCPKASKGNCRKAFTPADRGHNLYCSAHMIYCKNKDCNNNFPYLQGNQGCVICINRREWETKRKEETDRQAREERRQKELADKAEKARIAKEKKEEQERKRKEAEAARRAAMKK